MVEFDTKKKCSGCKKLLPLSEFNRNTARRDGLNYSCRKCWAEYQAERALLRKFGITKAEFDAILKRQNGGCAVCGTKVGMVRAGKRLRLCVDHCHKTGVVRGILCTSCNNGLGRFKDDPVLLERAALYLRR